MFITNVSNILLEEGLKIRSALFARIRNRSAEIKQVLGRKCDVVSYSSSNALDKKYILFGALYIPRS